MPRAKATDVVIHRIELGGREREMADTVIAAFAFNRVSTPIVAGLSDVSFVITVGAILAIFYPDIILPPAGASMDEVTNAIKDGVAQGQERARQEREQRGEATLDDSTGPLDFLGRLRYNLTNPNWGFGGDAPGFREAWRQAFG